MPTPVTHAISALSIAPLFARPRVPRRTWIIGAMLAVLPDVDVVAFYLGIPYRSVLGHRGLSHSLTFALVLSLIALACAFPRALEGVNRRFLWLYFFLCIVSHGVLDACTNGGLGIAFFAPFADSRYFFPIRPIAVSPISFHRLFSERGFMVFVSEFQWIWIPSLCLALLGFTLNRRRPFLMGKLTP